MDSLSKLKDGSAKDIEKDERMAAPSDQRAAARLAHPKRAKPFEHDCRVCKLALQGILYGRANPLPRDEVPLKRFFCDRCGTVHHAKSLPECTLCGGEVEEAGLK